MTEMYDNFQAAAAVVAVAEIHFYWLGKTFIIICYYDEHH